MVNAFHDAKEKARKKRQILATDRFGLSDLDNAVELPVRHSAARASTAAVLVDSPAMSGFKEHIQGVRADVARRRNERRGEPPVEFRLRPVPTARRLWANAMGGRLGIGSDGNRVALVTEPKTGLKLPGES